MKISPSFFAAALLGVSSLLFLAGHAAAATLALYPFDTVSANSSPSTITDPNATISDIAAGTGVTLVSSAGWGNPAPPSGAMQNANASNQADTVSGNDYWEFTLTPNAGYQANLANLTLAYSDNNNQGPTTLFIRSSVDDYASNLILVTDLRSFVSPSFNSLSADLEGSEFQNLTSATTFRIYAYGAVTTASVRMDNITLIGEMVVVPEPATVVFLLVSAGLLFMLRVRRRAMPIA